MKGQRKSNRKVSLWLLAIICLLLFSQQIASGQSNRASLEVCYTVEDGDTLSDICQYICGSGSQKTWSRESQRLGLKNPHKIFPGQKFVFWLSYPDTDNRKNDLPEFRVMWMSLLTGEMGHGEWLFRSAAIEAVKFANDRYELEIYHWLEYRHLPRYNLYYSESQRQVCVAHRNEKIFGKLDNDGKIVEYTEAVRASRSNKSALGTWDDYVFVGTGDWDHCEK